ncbi:MAG: ModD protein [Helicobacteraceae bacterium]|jgi:molybdenum transport protein|nr:ModD protein [Helicobacteraceae bacterium]
MARETSYIKQSVIDEWIAEEIGYFDLTTNALGIGDKEAAIEIATRGDCAVCGCEEAALIAQKLDLIVKSCAISGKLVRQKEIVFSAIGNAQNVHLAWRIAQNVISFASTISTRTNRLVTLAKAINPSISVGCTRKSIPSAKALSLKAVLAGGGSVHRAGLTETFLLFNEHRVFFDDDAQLFDKLAEIKRRLIEKKIIVEVKSIDEAIKFAPYADILQTDKLSSNDIREIKQIAPNTHIAVAGGIDPNNIQEYVKAGADSIVSSWQFFCDKPIDFEVNISRR